MNLVGTTHSIPVGSRLRLANRGSSVNALALSRSWSYEHLGLAFAISFSSSGMKARVMQDRVADGLDVRRNSLAMFITAKELE
ncbi:MAG: hypothetical protein ACRCVV_00485 [Shewanella sp.]